MPSSRTDKHTAGIRQSFDEFLSFHTAITISFVSCCSGTSSKTKSL
jgi:hypothetical protein